MCNQPFGEEEGCRGGEGAACSSSDAGAVDSQCFADYLSRRFGDEKSLAFYELVVARVPREVVHDALVRALEVPQRDIRRSRAALFTALVRPHLLRAQRNP
jgi:hypothetical protein